MLTNEPCYIKEAEVVEGTMDTTDAETIKEREELNVVLNMIGEPMLKTNTVFEQKQENGVMLLLFSPRTNQQYKRFMPESMIRDSLGEIDRELTSEELSFFAEQLRNRKSTINITILENDEDGVTFVNQENTPMKPKTFKRIGKSKKKGKKK